MIIEQIYTGCLAEATYYIESNGEAAIIDPLRDVEPYIEKARKNNAKIKYVFETHFHADFVSGHIDLANKTGAVIVYGPTTMETGFKALIAEDGEVFKLGNISLKVIHTPGHTMESSCFLLQNEKGKDAALFSGDTLFIGDVGRPDLAQKVIAELTQEKLAGHLFDSLRTKIIPLSDDLIVYPGHGAGSACGKNMSKEKTDTLGHQKKVNYALDLNLSKEEFIKQVLSGLMPPPGYFPQNVMMNIKGYESIDTVIKKGTHGLSVAEFESISSESKAMIVDTRDPQVFSQGFIPGSINIGLNGSFAVWAGTVIPSVKQNILIVAEEGKEEEAIIRLARVGYDNVLGFLKGGYSSWLTQHKKTDRIKCMSADQLSEEMEKKHLEILDVRKASEYDSEHLINAENMPLDSINDTLHKLDASKTYHIYCAGGYRSVIFISILKANGYVNLININGGYTAIKETNKFEVTNYVCPATML